MSNALIDWFVAAGFPLRKVSNRQWIEAMQTAAKDIPEFALTSLLTMFTDNYDVNEKASDQETVHYCCKITQAKLVELEIGYGQIDEVLLKCYRDYFLRSEFIDLKNFYSGCGEKIF